MSARMLLQRLDGVRQAGPGRWHAKCPAHQDRSPSLSIRELDDGRVLVRDFGGCGTDAVLESIGLSMSDLFPKKLVGEHSYAGAGRPFPAADILLAVIGEVFVVLCAARDLAAGCVLEDEDQARLCLAAQRLFAAMEVGNGRH